MGVKEKRHTAIRRLLKVKDVHDQLELVDELQRLGFDITQATVSRDIKDLNLVKVATQENGYIYTLLQDLSDAVTSEKTLQIARNCVLSINLSGQMVVIRTVRQGGSITASVIKSMKLKEVLGVISDTDTVFICTGDTNTAVQVADILKSTFKCF